MSSSRSHFRVLTGGRPHDEADAHEPLDLASVYRQHADVVATWTRRLGGPDIDVEDVVHEIFLVVQRRLPEWRRRKAATCTGTLRVVSDRRELARPGWVRKLGGDGPAADGARAADQPDALGLLERRGGRRAVGS